MKTMGKNPRPIDLRRDNLIKLSVKAKMYRKEKADEAQTVEEAMMWASMRINDIIALWYREQTGAKEFKTFQQWHNEGYFVKRGEKAFVLWGRKREVKDVGKKEAAESENIDYEFFPIAYLFSDKQIQKAEREADTNTVREVALIYKPTSQEKKNIFVKSSTDSAEVIKPIFEETNQINLYEFFYAIYLNSSNKVLSVMKISEGGAVSTVVDLKKILSPAILQNATGIIVCHNHPSGSMKPSYQDKKITKNIKEAAKLIDCQLLDHLIVTSDNYYSFADNGDI